MDKKTILEIARLNRNLRDDSRKVSPGDIFLAVDGASEKGAEYVTQAINSGARYVVCNSETARAFANVYPEVDFIAWDDTREAAWRLAQACHDGWQKSLKVIGITGTNGKTTSSYLLEHIFAAAKISTGVLGTINHHWPGFCEQANLTTPGPLELHALLEKMADSGTQWAIMEVSSHALSQMRVGGIDFSGALFTNLTQDHLDYHKNFEDYFQAKAKLFTELPLKDKPCAINIDDEYGRRLAGMALNVWTFGLTRFGNPDRHLLGEIIKSDMTGLQLRMSIGKMTWSLKSPLVGHFNALNLLGAQALALGLGFAPEQFACLSTFTGVPGRLERIVNDRNLHIFVDYAHTPDALLNAQEALKNVGFKRLLVVFGCGGNRDRSKRPLMGEAVARLADVAIVTSDNPRLEEPQTIIDDILPGLKKVPRMLVEPDRKLATEKALAMLGPEDALLIAGKGHEDYQILGTEKIHYSDQEVVREILE